MGKQGPHQESKVIIMGRSFDCILKAIRGYWRLLNREWLDQGYILERSFQLQCIEWGRQGVGRGTRSEWRRPGRRLLLRFHSEITKTWRRKQQEVGMKYWTVLSIMWGVRQNENQERGPKCCHGQMEGGSKIQGIKYDEQLWSRWWLWFWTSWVWIALVPPNGDTEQAVDMWFWSSRKRLNNKD